ncbi:site-specific integrase [Streptomyces polychromogenes]|uniref:Site-specific integrase n=1 Tax=Streptomyces polychromogenes TaxID=67342 RepID=A0ABP3EVT1_9ACTN
MEKQREAKKVRKPGKAWTAKTWLTHWVENVAPLAVSDNTVVGHRFAVRKHLIPGLGAHRLDRLKPEHIEIFYAKMQANGDYEVEPYSVQEVKRLLSAAEKHRNSARWAVALALGLRQGEVLGLEWDDVDLEGGFLLVRRSRHRPQYAHGCAEPCGRKAAGYCPQRRRTNPELSTTKSRAGRRAVGLPDQLLDLLRNHLKGQEKERAAAKRWQENRLVFPDEQGRSPSHRRDWAEWKDLLAEANVRDGRLHDARHTAATVLLILGVPERAVMGLMGWSTTAMAARYQHMVDGVRSSIAGQVDALIWAADDAAGDGAD